MYPDRIAGGTVPSRLWKPGRLLRKAAMTLGYDGRNWLRVRQIEAFERFLRSRASPGDVLEISPGWNEHWKRFSTRSYRAVDYPQFDISRDVLAETFDVVIADQVLEHVSRPLDAARNIHAMVKPGGYALVATPFLFRVHGRPHDYTRWTAAGLRQLLIDGGFEPDSVEVDAWGNKSCVRAHVGGRVRDYGFWRDMSNDPEYPIVVWAFAGKLQTAVPPA